MVSGSISTAFLHSVKLWVAFRGLRTGVFSVCQPSYRHLFSLFHPSSLLLVVCQPSYYLLFFFAVLFSPTTTRTTTTSLRIGVFSVCQLSSSFFLFFFSLLFSPTTTRTTTTSLILVCLPSYCVLFSLSHPSSLLLVVCQPNYRLLPSPALLFLFDDDDDDDHTKDSPALRFFLTAVG